jgi:K+-sensing histidine kinase KdpD
MADAETKTKGAIKAGNGKFIFQMTEMDKIEAGTGYSTALGPVIEGDRMQCTLVTKEKGTGLGLPLCRTMVEANGGKISLIRHDARGAVFSLTLPGVAPAHPIQEGPEL